MKITCSQVLALMNFYLEDKLTPKLKEYVDNHLNECPKCREIYMQAQYPIPCNDKEYQTKQYEEFKENLSAYIDNELDPHESIRMKKIAISNPMARKDLEDMYTFKKLMHNAFEVSKNELKTDYSKTILNSVNQTNKDPFYKLVGAFTVMVTIILLGFLITLYF